VRRILFVANGHGETAIAARIAREVERASPVPIGLDLFPLVGTGAGSAPLGVVGPRRNLPSGGLVAMGNVRAFSRDLAAGFTGLFARQLRFVAGAGRTYEAIVAVGDAYALGFALAARLPALFVGTAKSVYVAPYGPFERTLLRRVVRAFVRDEATANRLRSQHVRVEAPGNVIVDLAEAPLAAREPFALGLLPGSRENAYADGVQLARVVRAMPERGPDFGGLLSIAPTLDPDRFARALGADGWRIAPPSSGGPGVAFEAEADADVAGQGKPRLVGWSGGLATVLASSVAVLGQAGTGNEQAAAAGVPVVALDRKARFGPRRRGGDWYRMRQRRLLGEALLLVPQEPAQAAAEIAGLLADPERLRRMGEAGRRRMGPPGGAAAIARAILEVVA
jgi:uncharacterized protein (TIGR03492 family)